MQTILIVDDEELIRFSLNEPLQDAGYAVLEAGNGAQAREHFKGGVDLVLLDFKLPDADGIELLKEMKAVVPDIPVIMMTAHSTVERAVEAMKLGAFHYITKPIHSEEILHLIEKALEHSRLRREVKVLRASQAQPYGFAQIIGESKAMKQFKTLLTKVAKSPASTVLLTGESGTGKDLAAKAIHYNSDRADGPFMNITCSALPEALLESELFGHEKGAFTGADKEKKGLLEVADGGTVFLDEIGEMPVLLQAKLLRFLEDKAFRRVGGAKDIQPDVRVIAATNRNLENEVQQGKFREDLYYRLKVLPVEVPSLRERDGDIPLIVDAYIDKFAKEFRKDASSVSSDAIKLLESYSWPGNVRELKNAVERAMLLSEGQSLCVQDFQILSSSASAQSPNGYKLPPGGVDFEAFECDLVRQALERTGGNQTKAAQLLGMKRDQIRYRMEKFGLNPINTN